MGSDHMGILPWTNRQTRLKILPSQTSLAGGNDCWDDGNLKGKTSVMHNAFVFTYPKLVTKITLIDFYKKNHGLIVTVPHGLWMFEKPGDL